MTLKEMAEEIVTIAQDDERGYRDIVLEVMDRLYKLGIRSDELQNVCPHGIPLFDSGKEMVSIACALCGEKELV